MLGLPANDIKQTDCVQEKDGGKRGQQDKQDRLVQTCRKYTHHCWTDNGALHEDAKKQKSHKASNTWAEGIGQVSPASWNRPLSEPTPRYHLAQASRACIGIRVLLTNVKSTVTIFRL